MKKIFVIFLVLFVVISMLPAQNVGSNKTVIAYIIVYAETQAELQRKVQNYLILGIGWQPWGIIVLTTGYNIAYSGRNFSQVLVQYKE